MQDDPRVTHMYISTCETAKQDLSTGYTLLDFQLGELKPLIIVIIYVVFSSLVSPRKYNAKPTMLEIRCSK